MSELPIGFKSKIERMNDYYRQKTRVLPVSGAGVPVNSGDLSIFHLPAASLLDLSTFSLHFTGQLNGIAADQPAGFPKDIDTLIDILSIYINGTQIAYIQNYGNLWRILNDYNLSSEADSKNKTLYNSDPSMSFSMSDTGDITKYIKHANASPTMPVEAANSSGFYSISRWIGFLGNKMANIIDTNLVGTIEVRIQWAQPWVLWANTATKPTGYTLNNLTAYVDRIQWNNPHFEAVLNGILTGAGTMTIPYNNFRYHGGQFLNSSKSVVFRFQELSHSINGLLISFTDPDPNTIDALQLANNVTVVSNSTTGVPAAANVLALAQNPNQVDSKYFSFDKFVERGDYPLINTSKYFRRNGLGLGSTW
eukprot:764605-Hanusia_phi.AAC.1